MKPAPPVMRNRIFNRLPFEIQRVRIRGELWAANADRLGNNQLARAAAKKGAEIGTERLPAQPEGSISFCPARCIEGNAAHSAGWKPRREVSLTRSRRRGSEARVSSSGNRGLRRGPRRS